MASIRRIGGFACLVLALSLLTPAAGMAEDFKGKTSAGDRALFRTAPTGVPKGVFIEWKAPCKKGNLRFTGGTPFGRPFDQVSENRLVDAGPYRSRSKRFKFRYRVRVTAVRKTERLWKGTFSGKVRVFRKGKPYTTCRQPGINWYAQSKG